MQDHGAGGQFEAVFQEQQAAQQAREEARAEFDALDLIRPARREEDVVARVMAKAEAGLYGGQQADFTAQVAAAEITLANGGFGPCGPVDDFGRCSARFHSAGCSHGLGTDWLASGPPAGTYAAALASLEDGLELAAPGTVWGDPDDDGEPAWEIPARTMELAHQLSTDWGLGDVPGSPAREAYLDLLRAPAAPVSVEGQMYEAMGYASPPPARPVAEYPGIAELRAQMGL